MRLKTPLEMLYHKVEQHPNKVFLKQPIDGQIKSYTWCQFDDCVRRLAAGIQRLNLPVGSHIALLSKNCAEWFMADMAILMAGHVSVPIFPTAGKDTVEFVLKHAHCAAVFVGKLDKPSESFAFIPKDIISIGFPYSNLEVTYDWDRFIDAQPYQGHPKPDLDEVMTIIYTSGSTGAPKGVVHTYAAISWTAMESLKLLSINGSDRGLSYLPLAHVTERVLGEFASYYSGMEVSFVESLDTFARDIKVCEPTLFLSVPRLWTLFQLGVLKGMSQKKLDRLLKLPIIKNKVAKKIQSQLGLEHARLCASGSAPLPPALIEWFSKVGINISEGWGMTETCAYGTSCVPFRLDKAGSIGKAYEGVDIRISEEGEIQLKAPCTMKEYYREPEKTAEAFTCDGYFRTGDRGKIDKEGYVSITGRLKDIFKTAKGKYVSPAPIEARLAESTDIEQVCVTGTHLKQPIALLVLSEAAAGQDKLLVEQRLQATLSATNARLESHQMLDHLLVLSQPWTIENDLLTPTLKIKRHALEAKFADIIQSAYSNTVVWLA